MITTTAPVHADQVWEIVAEVWDSLLQLPAVRADHAFALQDAVADAIGEVVNVIAGNVEALLPGSAGLGLPNVEVDWAPVHAQLACRAGVEWPGHVARVGVWHLPSTARSNDSNGDRR